MNKSNDLLYQELTNEIKALRVVLLFLLKRELSSDLKRMEISWDRKWLQHRINKDKEKMLLLGYNPDIPEKQKA